MVVDKRIFQGGLIMFRVSMLLAVLAIFATVGQAQAQQIVSSPKKAPQAVEITDYPKYPIEYPADWSGPRIAGKELKPATTPKTPATTTAFRKPITKAKAILTSSGVKSSNTLSNQNDRVITNQPFHNVQPRIISPTYNRYPSFYSPSGCLTGR